LAEERALYRTAAASYDEQLHHTQDELDLYQLAASEAQDVVDSLEDRLLQRAQEIRDLQEERENLRRQLAAVEMSSGQDGYSPLQDPEVLKRLGSAANSAVELLSAGKEEDHAQVLSLATQLARSCNLSHELQERLELGVEGQVDLTAKLTQQEAIEALQELSLEARNSEKALCALVRKVMTENTVLRRNMKEIMEALTKR